MYLHFLYFLQLLGCKPYSCNITVLFFYKLDLKKLILFTKTTDIKEKERYIDERVIFDLTLNISVLFFTIILYVQYKHLQDI